MIYLTPLLNDNSHLKTARLIGFMLNYGHDLLYLGTYQLICNSHLIRNESQNRNTNSTLKGLELEDTTSLKDA